MSENLKFVLAGEMHEIGECDPTLSVLEYLRSSEELTGTKEGCAEGDCGACSVVLGELIGGEMRYRAINACIQFLPTLHGKWLITVEDLRRFADGGLHPAQQAMVDRHGSQCGFCTPGFVMSMFAMLREDVKPTRQSINDALAGNLCRCTGYGPIIDASFDMFALDTEVAFQAEEDAVAVMLGEMITNDTVEVAMGGVSFVAPATLDALSALYDAKPNATILAGGTDVGLWVTKMHRELGDVIYTGRVVELQEITETDMGVEIGAAVTLTDAMGALAKLYPDMGELLRRFSSTQVRNAGTLGGNIANGSPIGDMPPALIAANARLVLRKGSHRREIAIEDFFIEYGKQDRTKSELVEKVIIPKAQENARYRNYKISKRFDQDISAVCGAFNVTVVAGKVTGARIAFGGMAGIPHRANRCEAAIVGQSWNMITVAAGMKAMADDYSPMSDMRASADYRMKVAQNLLHKFYLETTSDVATRLVGDKELAHA